MKHATCTMSLIALAATAGVGQVTLVDLLPGYTLGGVHGISADGSTLAVDMFNNDLVGYDAYAWRSSGWSSLPRYERFNQWQGISADGRTTLSVSSRWGQDPRLERVENGVRETIVQGSGDQRVSGGLTRDGRTVFYTTYSFGGAPVELHRHRAGAWTGESLGTLSDRFIGGGISLTGNRDDFFVVGGQLGESDLGVGGMTRTLIYDAGTMVELPTLMQADIIHSTATGMTADGSVIVGIESFRDIGDIPGPEISWIYRAGILSELVVDGFSGLRVRGITDDGRAMIGYAADQAGYAGSFLFYDDGRSFSAEALLAANGVSLGLGQSASIESIAADGSMVFGAIHLGTSSAFGPDWRLFTVRVPGPGGMGLMVGAGLLAARRRR